MLGLGAHEQMSIDEWWASGSAIEHMLNDHGVEWYEVEEILAQEPSFIRARTVRRQKRYAILGMTEGGRRLTVIFTLEGPVARVITAYDTPKGAG